MFSKALVQLQTTVPAAHAPTQSSVCCGQTMTEHKQQVQLSKPALTDVVSNQDASVFTLTSGIAGISVMCKGCTT